MIKFRTVLSAFLLLVLVAACGEEQVTPSAPLIKSFLASPGTLTVGGETTLSWGVEGAATGLSIMPGIDSVSGSSVRVMPKETTTYTLTVTNSVGSHSAKVTVAVSQPKTPQPAPGLLGPNNDLFGKWQFEVTGESGTTVSGNVVLDADFMYEGAAGVWGIVAACEGDKGLCESASLAGIIHEPGTGKYQFGLGHLDGDLTVVFIAKDADGKLSKDGAGHPLLEGSGMIGEDEASTFRAHRIDDGP